MEMQEQQGQQEQEPVVGGVPHRLMDGYDGDGRQVPQEFIQQLLEGAPPAVQARLREVQGQQAEQQPAARAE